MTIDRFSRFHGGLYGVIVGDALGVPFEGNPRKYLDHHPADEMTGGGTHHQPPGSWSDDSSMTLCLMEGLVSGRELSGIAWLFLQWLTKAHWTPHGKVFSVGMTTSEALRRVGRFSDPRDAGFDGEFNQGNGSLMRALPLALMRPEVPKEKLAEEAEDVSSLTHSHANCKVACAVYTIFARLLLNDIPADKAWGETRHWARKYYHHRDSDLSDRLDSFLQLDWEAIAIIDRAEIGSSGFVLDTLEASLWCLATADDYRGTVLKAVNLGDDADTTAAVAGGLAGILYGEQSIPKHWKEMISRKEDIDELLSRAWSTVEGEA